MVDEVEKEEKKEESWVTSKWRPCMGWLYMATCAFDFILGPIFWAFLQTVTKQTVTQWMPLTLQGGGLFHMAMGAVLGISAYGRTQEKLGGVTSSSTVVPPAASAPIPAPIAAPIVTPAPIQTPTPSATVTLSSSGKKAPLPADEPAL